MPSLSHPSSPARPRRHRGLVFATCLVLGALGALSACGGGSGSSSGGATSTTPDATIQMAAQYRSVAVAPHPAVDPSPTDQLDAVRLADQATFGPNEAVVADIKANGARKKGPGPVMEGPALARVPRATSGNQPGCCWKPSAMPSGSAVR